MTELTIASRFERGQAFDMPDLLDVPASPARSRYDNIVEVRRSIAGRLRRNNFFNCKLFSDPAWDMLLELYSATLTQRRLTVSRLSERSRTPMTTSLRWISALEQEGLVKRERHALDGRQVFIVLTARAIVAMDSYFEEQPVESGLE